MGQWLWIGIGGFIGSVMRYYTNSLVQQMNTTSFPIGTLVVNVIGCFIIGALSYLAESRGILVNQGRSFVFIGLLGGFTTFSTFSNETVNIFQGGETFAATMNVIAHLVLGLGAVWFGRTVSMLLWK